MMIEQHYDEEVLMGLVDAPQGDPHLASCEKCASALSSIRQVTFALHDEATWDDRELDEEQRPATREALQSFASATAAEDSAAKPWVKALLARPSTEWHGTMQQHPEWRTAGFVRRLIVAVDAINFTAPTDAVELMKIAVDVVESLDSTSGRLVTLQAAAWREYGYALNYVGSHFEALIALDHCDEYLQPSVVNEYDVARAKLIRALALASVERINEAMVMAREARQTLLAFGDSRRARIAAMTEATILMDAHQYADALNLHLTVANDKDADEVSRACAVHNAAVCYRELSQVPEARALFVKAIAAYEKLGLAAFRAKARWNFASILVVAGQYEAAIALFREIRSELEELGLAHGVALICLDTAEALLLLGRGIEVSDLCSSAMEYFGAAKLTYTEGALAALAYLRKAADSRVLTIGDVRDVRSFIEILPKQPDLLFARPA